MSDKNHEKPSMLFANPKVVDINGHPIFGSPDFVTGTKHYAFVAAVPGKTASRPISKPELECIQDQDDK